MSTLALKTTTSPQKLLGVLTTGHLINDFYNVTLPFLLPTLIATFHLNFFQAGILAIATSLFSGLLQPVVGYAADRSGRRKAVILCGFLAFSLGLVAAGFATSYIMLVAAFFIFGLGKSTFHAQSTNFITRAFLTSKGRAMGIHGIGGSIGNFSAPIIVTSLIVAFTWQEALFLMAIPGVVMVIFLGVALPIHSGHQKEKTRLKIPRKLILLAINFGLILMFYEGFLVFLPTFLMEQGSSLSQAGFITAFMLFVGFLAQPVGGYIYDRLGGRYLFAISSLLAAVSLLLLTSGWDLPAILFIALVGASATATFPVALTMGSEIADGANVGLSVGMVFGVASMLASVTPAMTGYVADLFDMQTAFRLLTVLAVAAFGLSFFMPGKHN